MRTNFYLNATVCRKANCVTADIPWLPSLPYDQTTDVCVLTAAMGNVAAGMYVRDQHTWRSVMAYDDACNLLLTATKVKVIIFADVNSVAPDNSLVFKNGILQPGLGIIANDVDLWVVAEQVSTGAPVSSGALTPLAVAVGATIPALAAQQWIWSTVVLRPLYWDGAKYAELAPAPSLVTSDIPTLAPVAGDTTMQLKTDSVVRSTVKTRMLKSVGGVDLGSVIVGLA